MKIIILSLWVRLLNILCCIGKEGKPLYRVHAGLFLRTDFPNYGSPQMKVNGYARAMVHSVVNGAYVQPLIPSTNSDHQMLRIEGREYSDKYGIKVVVTTQAGVIKVFHRDLLDYLGDTEEEAFLNLL